MAEELDTIFMGLTKPELDKLIEKGAIGFNKAQTGFAVHVIICYAETEAGLKERLQQNGAKVVIGEDAGAGDAAGGMLADPNFVPGPNQLALPPTPGVPRSWPATVLLDVADVAKPKSGWRIVCRDPFDKLMICQASQSKKTLMELLEANGYGKDKQLSMFRELWRRG